jgi:hypothetical protein
LLTVNSLGQANTDVEDKLRVYLPEVSLDGLAALDRSLMVWSRRLSSAWWSLLKDSDMEPRRRLHLICLLAPGMEDPEFEEAAWLTSELSETLISELAVLPPGS